jgi:hypothetical protein
MIREARDALCWGCSVRLTIVGPNPRFKLCQTPLRLPERVVSGALVRGTALNVSWRMPEPEVFDWDEWENGKAYQLSNDELVGALLSEVSALRKRVKALEDRPPA